MKLLIREDPPIDCWNPPPPLEQAEHLGQQLFIDDLLTFITGGSMSAEIFINQDFPL